jgi:hypothetical protein
MMMGSLTRRTTAIACLSLGLIGAVMAEDDPVILKAQDAVAAKMMDPNSVQFKDLAHYIVGEKKLDAVCGSYNAKNAYGGYVGFRKFMVIAGVTMLRKDDVTAKYFDGLWDDTCVLSTENPPTAPAQ